MGRRSLDYVAWQPPPNAEDLKFQNDTFYARYGYKPGALSPGFFNSIFSDKTLAWEIGSRVSKAGDILRGPDQ